MSATKTINKYHPSKKPGRKTGSGDRTARLEIRCQPALLVLLDKLITESWYFTGWTRVDLLHELVRKAAMSAFAEPDESVWSLINNIKTGH